MASIGELTATLGLDTREFRAQAEQAQTRIRGIATDMRAGINTAGKYGIAFAGVATVLGGAFIRNAFEAAEEIRTLSRVSGESVKTFQEQAYAVRSVGIEQDKYADILKDVQDRVGDFLSTGGGPMADYFENIAPLIGQTAEEFRGLSGSDALQKYVSGLEAANVSQDQMVFYLEAMASDSTRLLPLLRNNGAEMEKIAGKARDMGIALSEIEITQMQEAKRATDLLGAAMDRASIVAVSTMSPAIRAVAEVLSEQMSGAAKDSGQDIVDWGDTFADILAFAADAAAAGIGTIGALFESLGITAGASAAQISALLQGEFQQAMTIGDEWAADQKKIWSDLANNSDFSKYRDRLAEIRQEMSERNGPDSLGGIDVQGNLPAPPKSSYGPTDLPEDEQQTRAEKAQQEFADEQAIYQQGLQDRFERIQQSLMSEAELEAEMHAERVEFLMAAQEGRIEIEGDANAELEKERARHADRMGEINRDQGITLLRDQQSFLNAMQRAQSQSGAAMVNTLAGAFAEITAAGSRENKALFEINKVAGIANAIISTQAGAAKALELPFPANIAAAATVTAAGLARVAAISSTSFGSGGAGGGAAAPSAVGGASSPVVEDVSRSRGQSVTLQLRGGNENTAGSIKDVVDQLNDFIKDGGDIGRLQVVTS